MKNPLDIRAKVVTAAERGPGAAPGLLVAPEGSPPPRLDVMIWSDSEVSVHLKQNVEEVRRLRKAMKEGQRFWLDVNGLGDAEVIAELGELFGLHRLSVEDAMNLHQPPNAQSYGEELFTVLQIPELEDGEVDFEQVTLWLSKNELITMQAKEASALRKLNDRFDARAPRLMQSGVDYLFYVAMDVLVDAGFEVLDAMDEQMEAIEADLLESDKPVPIGRIHEARQEVMILRRVLWSQARVTDQLLKTLQDAFKADTLPYLRDVQDHANRALDLADHLRESSVALFDLHRSRAGAQLNEVMKLLTIISTVFIPLTFVVGIYGMNFNPEASPYNLPELDWYYGYPFAWGVMLLSVILMLILFRRKGWL
jgi:magnesium transporter